LKHKADAALTDLGTLARGGDRASVVTLTITGPELSYRDRYRAAEEAERSGALFLTAQVDSAGADFEGRTNLGYVLDRVADSSGGRHEIVLSAMGADTAMRRLSSALRSAYRITYASVPDLKKRKLELSIARPKTKVLLPATSDEGDDVAAEPRP